MSVPQSPTEPGAAPAALSWFDTEDAPAARDLNTCIHCGLCLTACPTYRELKIEPDSPRGRIYLMRGLAEGRIEPSPELVEHLDNCLDCRACETVCPAGVPYSRMLEETRGQLERRRPDPGAPRALGRWALRTLFPHRDRMHLVADALRLAQWPPLARMARSVADRGLLPAFAARGLEITPAIEPRARRGLEVIASQLPAGATWERTPEAIIFRPVGTSKARVGFFTSCVMDVMFPRLNQDAVRLLVIAGAEVVVPHAQTCCGALHAHSGLRREAKRLANANVSAFAETLDSIVTDSAGCGAALRETGHLLGESANAAQATTFASRVRDVSEVLAALGLPAATGTLAHDGDAARPLRIAYHDPCHLAHAQNVRAQPRALLAALPGVELVALANSDWCCGSAGIYNLTHAAMADAQLTHKLDSIDAARADVVIASNPGCLLHMARGASQRGSTARMAHLVEILALAHPAPGGATHRAASRTPNGRTPRA